VRVFRALSAAIALALFSVPITAQQSQLASSPVPLPRLAAPLVVDGVLDEWTGAACVPLRCASNIAMRSSSHPWKGALVTGAEFHYAWQPEGLCVAAHVADPDVAADTGNARPGARDGVEFFLDLRPLEKVGTDPYGPGAYRVEIRPPAPGRKPTFAVDARDGAIAGVQIGGQATGSGYTVEALIPWPAGFVADEGTRVGLEAGLCDYTADNGEVDQPLVMYQRGELGFWEQPRRFTPWQLVDSLLLGASPNLGPMIEVDFPLAFMDQGLRLVTVDVAGRVAAMASAVHLTVRDSTGKPIFDKTSKVVAMEAPWVNAKSAPFAFDAGYGHDGSYTVETSVIGEYGAVLGTSRLASRACVRGIAAAMTRLAAGGPPAARNLSSAVGYLAAGAAVERYKYAVAAGRTAQLPFLAAELDMRFSQLDGKPLVTSPQGTVYDLQRLSRAPEVSVSFSGSSIGHVTVSCGAVPLAGATIEQCDTKQEALQRIRSDADGRSYRAHDTTYAGHPATVCARRVRTETAFDLAGFDPARHIMAVLYPQYTNSFDTADMDLATATRLVVLPGCPERIAGRMQAWAKEGKRRIVAFDDMRNDSPYVVVGDVKTPAVRERLGAIRNNTFSRFEPDAYTMRVAAGSRTYACASGSPAVARKLVGLLLAGTSISADDVDAIRTQLVRSLCPVDVKARAPALDVVYCGDVHAHTLYSEGRPSPEGLLLEGLYSNLDFVVVSDHGTILGAERGRDALAQHGFVFPVLVGEEFSTDSFQLNAWPLSARIPPGVAPVPMLAAAHVQAAVVQLCNPGLRVGSWVAPMLAAGLGSSGLDAWEHVPEHYDTWLAAGTLPHLVGSADAHEGIFADLERTVVLSAMVTPEGVAQAVKQGRSAIVSPSSMDFLYGPPAVTRAVWGALVEGSALKAQKVNLLKEALAKADLAGLVGDSKAGY
jgi:hypothetical protein